MDEIETNIHIISRKESPFLKKAKLVNYRKTVFSEDTENKKTTLGTDETLQSSGIVIPALDPELLLEIVTENAMLSSCIECMVTNIDGYGYTLENVAAEEIAPKTIKRERKKIKAFLDNINYDVSFTQIRRNTRRDMEIYGYAFWEIVRNGAGQVVEVNWLPAKDVRVTKKDEKYTKITQNVNENGSIVERDRKKRFKRFVWVKTNSTSTMSSSRTFKPQVYYKEFLDPRSFDKKTGKIDKSLTVDSENYATEVYAFENINYGTVYASNRWLGSLLTAIGLRMAEEINYEYFDNGRIIPFVVMVSGGALTKSSVARLEEKINDVGENWKAMILEALPAKDAVGSMGFGEDARSSAIKMEIKTLAETVPNDMMFMDYDEKGQEKIRVSFRLPKILLGDEGGYNRATADAALRIVDGQIFQPERDEFDTFMNKIMFPIKGFKYHSFKSLCFRSSDPKTRAEILEILTKTGAITPLTIRDQVGEILGREIELPDAEWTRIPFPLVQPLLLMGELDAASFEGDFEVPAAFRSKSARMAMIDYLFKVKDGSGLASALEEAEELIEDAVEN